MTVEARRQLSLTSTGVCEDPRAARAHDRYRPADARERDSDPFLRALVVAYWTNNPWFGYLAGGSFCGAIAGATLSHKPYRGDVHGSTGANESHSCESNYEAGAEPASGGNYCSSAADWGAAVGSSDTTGSGGSGGSCGE